MLLKHASNVYHYMYAVSVDVCGNEILIRHHIWSDVCSVRICCGSVLPQYVVMTVC
jgi:hypothetical protein